MNSNVLSDNEVRPLKHQEKVYPIIDLFKFIGSILILILHCQQYSDFYGWIWADSKSLTHILGVSLFDGLCRMAVPFFFIATAFFLFRKIRHASSKNEEKHIVKKYVIHLVVVYISWFIINIFWVIYKKFYVLKDTYALWQMLLFLLRDIAFQNGFGASWFIMASIIDSILVYLLTRKRILKEIGFIFSLLMYLLCLLSSWYSFICPDFLSPSLNFINSQIGRMSTSFSAGLIFFYIGFIFANNEDKISNYRLRNLLISTVLFVILYYAEIFFVPMIPNYARVSATAYISSLFLIPCLFLLGINSNIKITHRFAVIAASVRKQSSLIYYSHCTILLVVSIILSSLFSSLSSTRLFVITLPVVLLVQCLFVFLYVKLSKTKYFAFLNKIV